MNSKSLNYHLSNVIFYWNCHFCNYSSQNLSVVNKPAFQCQQALFTVCWMQLFPCWYLHLCWNYCFRHMTFVITSMSSQICLPPLILSLLCMSSVCVLVFPAEELMSQSSSQVRVSAEVDELRSQLGRLNIRNKELELQNSGRSNDHARMLKQVSCGPPSIIHQRFSDILIVILIVLCKLNPYVAPQIRTYYLIGTFHRHNEFYTVQTLYCITINLTLP